MHWLHWENPCAEIVNVLSDKSVSDYQLHIPEKSYTAAGVHLRNQQPQQHFCKVLLLVQLTVLPWRFGLPSPIYFIFHLYLVKKMNSVFIVLQLKVFWRRPGEITPLSALYYRASGYSSTQTENVVIMGCTPLCSNKSSWVKDIGMHKINYWFTDLG